MTDNAFTSTQPTETSGAHRRRAILASVLAAVVAIGVALALLLTTSSAHDSSVGGQPVAPAPTGTASTASTSTSPSDPTTVRHGGGSDRGIAGSGGGDIGSSGGSSHSPSGGRTDDRTPPPPDTIPTFDLHAFPSGPASVDESICPAHLSFAAVISAERGPVSVTYQWVRSDGAHSPVSRVDFTGSGPQLQTVFSTWDLGGDYTGSEHLQVLTPIATSAAVMPFSVHCAPTATVSDVWAAPAAGTCDSLATTLHATVTIGRAAVLVRYHWVIDGHTYPTQDLLGTAVTDHTISDPLTFSTSVHGRSLHPVRLVIDSPYTVTSSGAYMSVDCA